MSLTERWEGVGGYREVLKIAGPLILSMGSWSLMHFVDRMFLTWYDREALAAALPAGLLSFAFSCFFFGTAGYVNTFVAQYSGAGRPERVGSAVWQGIYFSVASGVLMLALLPFSKAIFAWAGHEPSIQPLEVVYFQILTGGVWAAFLMAAISSFFTGRGETRVVMWVNVLAVAINIALDYVWIFGKWGFPRWGIRGAAWATVVAHIVGMAVFFGLMLRKQYRERYHTLRAWRFEWALFKRLMRFGLPNGVQFAVELFGFAMFVLLVGRLGTVDLAATNLTFNINTLAFLPMIGFGIAVSTLVGQYLGQDRADLAERSTWSAVHLCQVYMIVMALAYVLIPELFLMPFASEANPAEFQPVQDLCIVLLRFVALYCLFDAAYIVFSSAVKGAGDTRFVMWVILGFSWFVMILPVYLAIVTFEWGLYVAWCFCSAYIILMGTVFLFRFRGGKWKTMRVIEKEGISLLEGRQAAEVQIREQTDTL